jgi:ferric-dicitrate binding protein FerR (iron transport regulator)
MSGTADTNEHDPVLDAEDEEMTARLLRLGGLRADAPVERAERVRRAVLDECRAVARGRVVRRRVWTSVALLSAAAAALMAVRVMRSRDPAPPPALVATVDRLEGRGGRATAGGSTPSGQLAVGNVVRVGDRIETDASGRVGLRLSATASVRFDHGSVAHFTAARTITLDAGAVYVDSGIDAAGFEVHTPWGVVRDIGTQFEIRIEPSFMRVRVRAGIVELHREAAVTPARAGTELRIDPSGVMGGVATSYGPEWRWAAAVGPAFDIEGRPLAAFLDHLCREQGWTLAYADARVARAASGIILHGSTEGLEPMDALATVLATSGLSHRFDDGQILVASGDRP